MSTDYDAVAAAALAASEEAQEEAALDREAVTTELQRMDAATASGQALLEVLPPTLAARFRERAEAYPVASEMLVPALLAITCSIWGQRGKVVVKIGHEEPLIVWVGAVTRPSSLKSPVAADMQAPLKTIYEEKRAAFEAELGRIQAEQEHVKKEITLLQRQIKAQEESNGDASSLIEQLAGLRETIPVTPTLREYFVSELSWEQLGQFCSRPNVLGLVLHQDELEAWLALLDRDPSLRSRWLSLWSGGGLKQDYKNAPSAYATRTAVSIFGCTTPDNIRDRVAAEAAKAEKEHREGRTGDGMWPRMLWCRPPHVAPYSTDKECTIYPELLRLYRAIDDLAHEDITLQPEARAYLRREHDALVSEAEQGSQPLRQVFINKLRGYLYRFAGWVSIIDRAWESQPFSGVTVEQARRAAQLARYFLGQFDQMAPLLGVSSVPEWVTELRELARKKGGSITVREYVRSVHRMTADTARERFQSMPTTYGLGRVEQLSRGRMAWHSA